MEDIIGYLFILLTIGGALLLIYKRASSSLVQSYSSTMGVLGTFVGVYVGLMNFDETQIMNSIPPLLGGLKTAFSTSIAGMIIALLARLFYHPQVKDKVVEDKQQDLKEILILLNSIWFELKKVSPIQKSDLDGIEKNISEGVVEINNTSKAGFNLIDKSLQNFGERLAEQSSKELVASIQRVMDDFDAKINSQLGEEFRRLSESTDNLNKWQQENIRFLEEVKGYSIQQVEVMKKYADASDVLQRITDYIALMEKHFLMLQDIESEMKTIVPNIKSEMNSINANIKTMSGNMSLLSSDICKALSTTSSTINASERRIRESVGVFESSVRDTMSQFSRHLVGILEKACRDIDVLKKQNPSLFR